MAAGGARRVSERLTQSAARATAVSIERGRERHQDPEGCLRRLLPEDADRLLAGLRSGPGQLQVDAAREVADRVGWGGTHMAAALAGVERRTVTKWQARGWVWRPSGRPPRLGPTPLPMARADALRLATETRLAGDHARMRDPEGWLRARFGVDADTLLSALRTRGQARLDAARRIISEGGAGACRQVARLAGVHAAGGGGVDLSGRS